MARHVYFMILLVLSVHKSLTSKHSCAAAGVASIENKATCKRSHPCPAHQAHPRANHTCTVQPHRPWDVQEDTIVANKPYRVIFTSCNRQPAGRGVQVENEDRRSWRFIRSRRPSLLVWMGDNVYPDQLDVVDPRYVAEAEKNIWSFLRPLVRLYLVLDSYRTVQDPVAEETIEMAYRNQTNYHEYQLLKDDGVHIIGTWDDHDMGEDNANKFFPHKHRSRELLLDFLGVPADSPRRSEDWHGVFNSRRIQLGSGHFIRFILLDTRFNRDPWRDFLRGDILGQQQWQWFEKELERSRDDEDDATVIVSSMQVLPPATILSESWPVFPAVRERLLQMVLNSGVRLPLLLSGDVHFAEVSAVRCFLRPSSGDAGRIDFVERQITPPRRDGGGHDVDDTSRDSVDSPTSRCLYASMIEHIEAITRLHAEGAQRRRRGDAPLTPVRRTSFFTHLYPTASFILSLISFYILGPTMETAYLPFRGRSPVYDNEEVSKGIPGCLIGDAPEATEKTGTAEDDVIHHHRGATEGDVSNETSLRKGRAKRHTSANHLGTAEAGRKSLPENDFRGQGDVSRGGAAASAVPSETETTSGTKTEPARRRGQTTERMLYEFTSSGLSHGIPETLAASPLLIRIVDGLLKAWLSRETLLRSSFNGAPFIYLRRNVGEIQFLQNKLRAHLFGGGDSAARDGTSLGEGAPETQREAGVTASSAEGKHAVASQNGYASGETEEQAAFRSVWKRQMDQCMTVLNNHVEHTEKRGTSDSLHATGTSTADNSSTGMQDVAMFFSTHLQSFDRLLSLYENLVEVHAHDDPSNVEDNEAGNHASEKSISTFRIEEASVCEKRATDEERQGLTRGAAQYHANLSVHGSGRRVNKQNISIISWRRERASQCDMESVGDTQHPQDEPWWEENEANIDRHRARPPFPLLDPSFVALLHAVERLAHAATVHTADGEELDATATSSKMDDMSRQRELTRVDILQKWCKVVLSAHRQTIHDVLQHLFANKHARVDEGGANSIPKIEREKLEHGEREYLKVKACCAKWQGGAVAECLTSFTLERRPGRQHYFSSGRSFPIDDVTDAGISLEGVRVCEALERVFQPQSWLFVRILAMPFGELLMEKMLSSYMCADQAGRYTRSNVPSCRFGENIGTSVLTDHMRQGHVWVCEPWGATRSKGDSVIVVLLGLSGCMIATLLCFIRYRLHK